MEVTEVRMRSRVGMLQYTTWSVGVMLWGLWAYLVRDWRWLQTMVSLPTLLFHPALWLLQESPRWLIVRGQNDKALKVLQKAAAMNKVELPSDNELLATMKNIQHSAQTLRANRTSSRATSCWHALANQLYVLLRTPKLRLITLCMAVSYFVVSLVFYGLNLSASTVKLSPFIFTVIAGGVELPAMYMTLPLVSSEWLGRKRMAVASFGLCGIILLIQPFTQERVKWLSIMLIMVGKMCSMSAFVIVILFASELYPTEVRTWGMGTCIMFARVGGIVAPYILSSLSEENSWQTSVVFGVAALVAASAMFPLWETLNTDLPDTIPDLEEATTISTRSYRLTELTHGAGGQMNGF